MSHLCAFRLFDVRPAWVAKPTMIQRKYEIFSSRIRADWGGWGGGGKCWAVTWVHSEDDTSVQQTPNMAGDGQMRPLFTKNEKVWWRPFNLKSWIMALHGHIWELVELTGTWFTFKYGSYFCRSANSLRDCQSGLIMGRNSVFNRITGLYLITNGLGWVGKDYRAGNKWSLQNPIGPDMWV